MYIYIYMYIYIERERKKERCIYFLCLYSKRKNMYLLISVCFTSSCFFDRCILYIIDLRIYIYINIYIYMWLQVSGCSRGPCKQNSLTPGKTHPKAGKPHFQPA